MRRIWRQLFYFHTGRLFRSRCESVLDSAAPSNLIESKVLTVKDNITFNPIFGMLSLRAIQNIPDMVGYLG